MRENLSKDLEIVIERIQNGTFSGVELRSLLISVRYAQPRSSILEELGDFVAHYDERTKGILYEHIDNFMFKFINFAMSGGSVTIPGPLFDQNTVVSELIKVIRANKIFGFEESKFRFQTFNIMYRILEIIAETKIRNAKVANCRFSAIEKTDSKFTVFFCFGPVDGRFLNIKKEVKIPAIVAVKD